MTLGVQAFGAGSNCRCGGNRKRTGIRGGIWRCDWIDAVSWKKLNRWGVAFYEWQRIWFLGMESTCDDGAVKTTEMTIRNSKF